MNEKTDSKVLEAGDPVRLIADYIEWTDDFSGPLPESMSDRLFALYARARSYYLAVDPVGHDAQRASRVCQAARQSLGGEA